jgi:hypothetical protein
VSYHADSGTVRPPGGHDVTVATAAVPGVSGARDEIRIAGRPGQQRAPRGDQLRRGATSTSREPRSRRPRRPEPDVRPRATGWPRGGPAAPTSSTPRSPASPARSAPASGSTSSKKLIEQITASWSEIARQPAKQVVAGLTEIDSDVTMGYGLILQHHGDEAAWAWFVDNADALELIQGTGL